MLSLKSAITINLQRSWLESTGHLILATASLVAIDEILAKNTFITPLMKRRQGGEKLHRQLQSLAKILKNSNICAKRLILEVWQGPKYTSGFCHKTPVVWNCTPYWFISPYSKIYLSAYNHIIENAIQKVLKGDCRWTSTVEIIRHAGIYYRVLTG